MKKHEKWILGLKLKKDHLSHLTCLWVIEFEIGAQQTVRLLYKSFLKAGFLSVP